MDEIVNKEQQVFREHINWIIDHVGNDLNKFINFLKEIYKKVPKNYHHTTIINLEEDEDEFGRFIDYNLVVSYMRPETIEERKDRLKLIQISKEINEKRDRQTYEYLKKKFESV
jgi:hypothetical protein